METRLANIEKNSGLSANALKMIAIIAMTIDHLAWTFMPGYNTTLIPVSLHIIGRLTAPIMMFFVVEGYYHTKNLKKYITRMFIFAFISHFAYAIMFNKSFIPFQNSFFDQTSVIWTFALGLVMLATVKSENPNLKPWHRSLVVCVCVLSSFCADWSSPAALAILHMGLNRGDFKKQMMCLIFFISIYSIVFVLCLNLVYGVIQMCVVLAIPLLHLYNGKRGKWKGMKWFFYLYYPLHLAVLGVIRFFLAS